MVPDHLIREAADILVREARPLRVVLFGSHARGEAGEDSDVDFLVIERKVQDKLVEMYRLRKALSPLRIPVDVVVADAEHVASEWADFPGSYLYDALREGKVLYDAMAGTGAAVS